MLGRDRRVDGIDLVPDRNFLIDAPALPVIVKLL